MSANQKEQWEESADSQNRYPEIDYSKPGWVAVIGLEGQRPVGYLLLQVDTGALTFLTNEGTARAWGFGVRHRVEEIAQAQIDRDPKDPVAAAFQAWGDILAEAPLISTHPDDAPLSELADSLRQEWNL